MMAEQMDVDKDIMKERNDEIDKIIKITNIIIEALGDERLSKINTELAANKIDLDLSDEISGVLMTIFTCLRKEVGDPTGSEKYKTYKAKISGIELEIGDLIAKIKTAKIELNFTVATPIVEIMTLFRNFYDEVRTGVTRFKVRQDYIKRAVKRDSRGVPVGRADPKESTQTIGNFGLINHHIPLLQGITLPPERRTGVIRSLGPLTQAILLVMENRYFDKLNNALKVSLQMLPMANEIIACLREAQSGGAVTGVLKELGDILILSTARATQKFYFPLMLIIKIWKTKPKELQWSFSGVSPLKYFADMCTEGGLVFIMRSGGSATKTAEVVFHAMFGTYLDDLKLLETITSHKARWHLRKEVNDVFVKRSEKKQIEFKPIYLEMVSKMAQSLLTKSLGNIEPVATSRPSFSGFRKRNFTQEFLNYLTTGKSAINYSSDPLQLQFALKKTKDALIEEKDTDKLLQTGTCNWWKKIEGEWKVVEEKPEEGNRKFYGKD